MNICTNLDHIREMAVRHHDENIEFRSYIVQSPMHERQLDSIVRGLTLRAMAEVDCVACHNCCVMMTAQATELEVGRMSCSLGLSAGEFTAQYIVPSVLTDPVLRQRDNGGHEGNGCALMCDGRRTVYSVMTCHVPGLPADAGQRVPLTNVGSTGQLPRLPNRLSRVRRAEVSPAAVGSDGIISRSRRFRPCRV
jgi:hypothetical protein